MLSDILKRFRTEVALVKAAGGLLTALAVFAAAWLRLDPADAARLVEIVGLVVAVVAGALAGSDVTGLALQAAEARRAKAQAEIEAIGEGR